MPFAWHGVPIRVLFVTALLSIGLGISGCKASFCAGSGCDSGKIFFGSNWKQQKAGGSIDVVGQASTFQLTQNVAFVAHLSDEAKSKSLKLQVAHAGTRKSVPYSVSKTSSNELAALLTTVNLRALDVTKPGTYTFSILRGTKQLAQGSITEK